MNLLKRLESLRLPIIKDGIISDDLSWMEFDYSSIDWVNPDTIPDVKNGKLLWFNQWKYTQTKQACTIVNSSRALLKTANAVWWYSPTIKDIFDIVTMAIGNMWYVVGKWWYVYKGVDATRTWWNDNHPDKKINSFLITYDDPDFQKIMDKWYSMVGSYKGNNAYWVDFRKDAILNGTDFKPSTYWHCTLREKYNNGEFVNDSYDGNWYNIYKLLFPKQLIDNGVWSNNHFFFIPAVDNSDEIKRLNAIILDCTNQITSAENLIKVVNDESFKKIQENLIIANNKKIEDAKDQLKVL